jgi:flagella basal body P-ring formation protein FlgA
MKTLIFALYSFALATPVTADSVVATRAIQPKSLITAEDVTMVAMQIPNALGDPAAAIGKEARISISPGRAIKATDLVQATLVERNAIVGMSFVVGGLEIVTEGRALARGAEGDVIDIMNLSSRTRLRGRILADGSVTVEAGS